MRILVKFYASRHMRLTTIFLIRVVLLALTALVKSEIASKFFREKPKHAQKH